MKFFFQSKTTIYLSPGLHKGRPSYKRSLQLSKENIQHFKTWNFLLFSTFLGHFCPPGSGSGFRIRIRIHWPDWIRIQFGSGSATLLSSYGTLLYRLFPGVLPYEEDCSTAVDNLLDGVTSLLWSQPRDRQPILRTFAFKLGKLDIWTILPWAQPMGRQPILRTFAIQLRKLHSFELNSGTGGLYSGLSPSILASLTVGVG